MCVECLEKIAENLEKFEQGGRTILPHEVWTALRSRCFVAGARLRVSRSSTGRGSVDTCVPVVRQGRLDATDPARTEDVDRGTIL